MSTLRTIVSWTLTSLMIMSVVAPQLTHAQADIIPKAATPMPQGLSSCFDHYKFGSLNAIIDPALSSVSAGSSLGFTGTLTNENAYPLTDVVVYAKIFQENLNNNDNNGPDVVDFFPITDSIDIAASSTVPIEGEWKVPVGSTAGNYRIATFVVSKDRFEMSGLVFTDDVVGTSQNFMVQSDVPSSVRFDKDTAMVGDQQFVFAAYPPRVSADGKLPVTIQAVNSSVDMPFKGTVTWKLYYWDQIEESHLLDTKTYEVKVHPEGTTTLSYTVTDTAHTVYYLQGEIASEQGAKSIVGIRFVDTNVNEPRLNFVAVDDGTAVACVHSTGDGLASSTQVSLTVTRDGWYAPILRLFGLGVLAHAEFDGSATPQIYALTAPLSHRAASYDIQAEISQNGKHIDTVTTTYSCTLLGTSCTSQLVWSLVITAVILLIIIAIVALVTVLLRRRHRTTVTPAL